MKGSLIIVGFFILGLICGLMHWLPDLNAYGNVSFLTLCALLFCVGMTVGNNTTLLKSFTKLDPRLMLLPLMTIVGTLAATAVASLGLPNRSLADCLAVGSGFGYYSLSSILITQYRGPDLGTVALLANIIRRPIAGQVFRPLKSHILWWCHNNGHNPTHHHPLQRPGLRTALALSRLPGRFLRPLPGHLLLLPLTTSSNNTLFSNNKNNK